MEDELKQVVSRVGARVAQYAMLNGLTSRESYSKLPEAQTDAITLCGAMEKYDEEHHQLLEALKASRGRVAQLESVIGAITDSAWRVDPQDRNYGRVKRGLLVALDEALNAAGADGGGVK